MDFKDLHSEQKAAVNWILNNKLGCLAPECGSGKTVIGLTAFRGIQKLHPGRLCRLLVVSTKQGVRETWANEHRKWKHLETLSVAVLEGEKGRREKIAETALRDNAQVYCISYNNLDWFLTWQQGEGERYIFFDMVFADEGSCLKGHDSKWRKALTKLSEGSQYRIISTATPAPHDAMDYWGLCKYMDNGACLFSPTITEFRSRYCIAIPIPNKVGMRYALRKGATEEIEKKVKHLFYTFNIIKETPIEEINCWRNFTDEGIKIYKLLEEQQCLDALVTTEFGIQASQDSLDALSLSNKLAQLANGFVYLAPNKKPLDVDTFLSSTPTELSSLISKKGTETLRLFPDRVRIFLRLLDEIKQKHGNVPVAVAYLFREDLEELKRAIPEGVSDTEANIVDRWNKGEIPYLFLQYARSSKSLNLQKGGNILAVYSPTWNWEHDYQIVRRLARQGQPKEKVYLYRLWIRDTIDEEKFQVLSERGEGHKSFQRLILERGTRIIISPMGG